MQRSLFEILSPEIVLVVVACALFLCGFARGKIGGRGAAWVALIGILAALGLSIWQLNSVSGGTSAFDYSRNFRVNQFSTFVRVFALLTASLLVLLSFPGDKNDSGNQSLDWGRDGPEYFGLLLLSFAGLTLVPQCNDLIGLFMALELASIPTYILVSISRPLPAAQEAGVKYFFLGALAAALVLMGFAYLYGTTGSTNLSQIGAVISASRVDHGALVSLTPWQTLAAVLIVLAVGFKLAAVPLHAYAGDVYQGAATPVTAVLGFVPKTVGIVIQIKILMALGGGDFGASPSVAKLMWAVAVLTMLTGNIMGLAQNNVKRVLAYSSVGHSGYMLAGVTAALMLRNSEPIAAVLFYIATYGITSTAAFGILSLIPSRQTLVVRGKTYRAPATGAESFEDITGVGRDHPLLGLGMAIACFALIGLPLTAGFWGKYFIIAPALAGAGSSDYGPWLLWLAVLLIVSSAIGAAFYLRIIFALFARPISASNSLNVEPAEPAVDIESAPLAARVAAALAVLVVGVVGIGVPCVQMIRNSSQEAADALRTNTDVQKSATSTASEDAVDGAMKASG